MTSAPVTVRICHLYPSLFSVAGDRGNLFALTQRCAWRGIRCSVTEADVGEVPDFTQSDLILVHGGQDREMTAAARDLAAKAGPLREAIEADAVVLAVCAGYQLLGQLLRPVRADRRYEGIGVLDAVTEGGPTRFIGHVAVECDFGSGSRRQLTGFENHSGRTYLGSGAEAARARARRGLATTARTAPRAPGTGRSTPPTCTGRCCRRTRGWPTTCSPGRSRTATAISARSRRSPTRRRRRRTPLRSVSPGARPAGGGPPRLAGPGSGGGSCGPRPGPARRPGQRTRRHGGLLTKRRSA